MELGKPESAVSTFEELLEKKVKSNFGYGRIYLPKEWVGKKVKVVRID